MEEKNKIYTATDFERYHSGEMPADEMHALEKAALEDPFLADALEGCVNAPDFKADILELKSRLEEKKKKKKIFSISSITENKWWRIAALFIIIAGVGFLFYKINFTDKEDSLATNELKSLPKNKDSAVTSLADSVATSGDMAFQKPEKSTFADKDKAASAEPKVENKKADENRDDVAMRAEPGPLKKSPQELAVNSAPENYEDKSADRENEKEYKLKGKVTDETGKPIAMASVHDDARKKTALTDTTGNFVLSSPDSNATASVAAAGYATKKVTLLKDEQPTIAMNKSDTNLSEVVVTGYGQEKKKERALSRENALSGKIAGVEIATNGIRPFPKNEKFDQYLSDNIQPVFNENGERVAGEVLLSFVVNKKGKPENIKVVKSSCKACEEEAIRLLENGPGWANKSNKRGTVVIKF